MSYLRSSARTGGTRARTGGTRTHHGALGADPAPVATIPECLPVACKPGISGWTLVGIAVVGLALNVFKMVKPNHWGELKV